MDKSIRTPDGGAVTTRTYVFDDAAGRLMELRTDLPDGTVGAGFADDFTGGMDAAWPTDACVPTLSRVQMPDKDLGDDVIYPQGTTIVPLDVLLRDDGSIHIRAKDTGYASPGPEEVQKF